MPHVIHWFRRDFRVHDNTALLEASRLAGADGSVTGFFIIDPRWWHADRQKLGAFQAGFWLASLHELQASLRRLNMPLVIRTHADPVAAILKLAREIGADAVTYNKEYEPDQRAMDARLAESAGTLKLHPCKDAAVFEEEEILTNQQGLYSVFTPYKNAYLRRLAEMPPHVQGTPPKLKQARKVPSENLPTLNSLGFTNVRLEIEPGESAAQLQLEKFCESALPLYAKTRDFPALTLHAQGTSRLSAHLSAGTVSIRQAVAATLEARKRRRGPAALSADTFLAELIWRDFYRMILFHHPHTVSKPFNEKYAGITWQNNPAHLAAVATGRTGYPIVDAAIAQLLQTGFMHNRLRMIAAMFLTKDLDTHWIHGERFFMRTLIDYDQAANVGGWQWSASTGTDAAPYFRVMNPILQSQRFDPEGEFIRRYLPQLKNVPTECIHAPWQMPADVQLKSKCKIGIDYPAPIIDHATAKTAAIAKFKKIN